MGKLKPILLSTAMALGATPLMAQEEQFITIGTGGQTGVYLRRRVSRSAAW